MLTSPAGHVPTNQASPRGRRRGGATTARMGVVATVALLVVALVPQVAAGQSLEDERDQAESARSETRRKLDVATAELSELRSEVEAVERRVTDAQARLEVVEDEVTRVTDQVAGIAGEILALGSAVQEAKGRITDRARALYMQGNTTPATPLLALLDSDNVEQALERATLAGRLAGDDQRAAEEAEAQQAHFQQLEAEFTARQDALEDLQAEADEARREVAAELDQAQELRDEMATRQDRLSGRSDELGAEIARIDTAIEQREAERRERERREREAREREAREAEEAAAAAAAQAADNSTDDAGGSSNASANGGSTGNSSASANSGSTGSSNASSSGSSGSGGSSGNSASSSGSSGSGGSSGSSGNSASNSPQPAPDPAPPPSGSGRVCPMSSTTKVSGWGDSRGGGSRLHKGVDLMGGYRQNVYAIVSGTWDVRGFRPNSTGNWAILRGDDGNTYWYLHLDAHAVSDGARVSRGQHVAYNGNTGAPWAVHHIHFEIHPGGGGAVDPWPYLSGIC